ncbi:hypothetical protein ASD83_20025 [Devosia sp. Root685]|uniref:DUF4037 domain-containing protein n=1 Tax=Devosia sp. Root685 TaxID=1736587 RepID=UPI0006F28C78|nr:DUF4037 domain-containing protein [Devosia sp. Root685]KRA95105.1 hypothetical protein ASD83_20025 [Devosia sp. Root685]
MQGIELSRRFYADVVAPWLVRVAPDLPHSAALIGYGSELLGFDDETSKDHNWGPRVHIYLSEGDFAAHAHRLLDDFASVMPETFLGEPAGWRSRPHPAASGPDAVGAMGHGLEFHTFEGRLEAHTGLRSLENLTPLDWLGLPEQSLLAFTAGAVFRDDGGRLETLQKTLAYFPRDVWLYKIACQWGRIAEERAFVGRAGQAGDDLGSRIIAARLCHDVMAMAFLLERRYTPYPKWFGTGFSRLAIAKTLTPHLDAVLRAEAWQERGEALAAAYLALAQWQKAKNIAPFEPVIGPYFDRPFTTINADDAVASAMAAIADPAISMLPVMGAIDQVSDLTPLRTDAATSRAIIARMLDGKRVQS